MFNHELGFYANLMLHLNIILTHLVLISIGLILTFKWMNVFKIIMECFNFWSPLFCTYSKGPFNSEDCFFCCLCNALLTFLWSGAG